MSVRPHDRFGAEITLRPDDVADYARRAGDLNPIHHDPAYAAGTRFARPIASGAQTTGLLMGLTATHFSRGTAMLGLDFWFRFRRPVFADETVRLEWLVVAVRRAPRLGGAIVELRGRLRNAAGETYEHGGPRDGPPSPPTSVAPGEPGALLYTLLDTRSSSSGSVRPRGVDGTVPAGRAPIRR